MKRRFPRRVERWRGQQALMVGCNACGRSFVTSVEDVCSVQESGGTCPKCGESELEVAYHEATRCPGCLKLHDAYATWELLGPACSQRCKMIADYADFLRERIKRSLDHKPWRGYA